MCKNKKLVYAVICFLAVSTALAAREGKQKDKMTKGGMSGKSSMLISGDKIMGTDVMTHTDEKLGNVEELVINQNNDEIQYVVVSSEGMLHPVPMQAIQCSDKDPQAADSGREQEKKLTINMTRDQFHQSPTVESVDIQQLSDQSLKQRIESFYSTQMEGTWDRMKSDVKERIPGTQERQQRQQQQTTGQQATLLKYSDIKGLDVQNLNDEKIASVSDVVIHSRKGNLAYALVDFGGMLGGKTAAVPWSALSIQPDGSLARLDATEDKLQTAALSERGNITELNQKQFAQRVHEVFGAEPYWQIYGFEAPGEEGSQQQMYQQDRQKDEMKKEGKDRMKQRQKIDEQEGSF
jgi:sporulation protein YlmC with PRC-barrel domain